MTSPTAKQIIDMLGLAPHPEGGWYAETWRADATEGERAAGTAIYYLLEAGDVSHWHRVDATEIWHWYAGGPLSLTLSIPLTKTLKLSSLSLSSPLKVMKPISMVPSPRS